MSPQHSVYLRMEDGRLMLIVVRPDQSVERFELRPVQLLTLAREAAALAWAHFEIRPRE